MTERTIPAENTILNESIKTLVVDNLISSKIIWNDFQIVKWAFKGIVKYVRKAPFGPSVLS